MRYQKAFQCFSGKPFDEVGAVLEDEMERCLLTLDTWTVQFVKDNGEKVTLR